MRLRGRFRTGKSFVFGQADTLRAAHSARGLPKTLGLKVNASAEAKGNCPECRGLLRAFEDGSCRGSRCGVCGWSVVTTNHNTASFDETSYSVWAQAPSMQRFALISKLAVILGCGAAQARVLVDSDLPVAPQAQALEVQRVASALANAGIDVRIEPPFPWPLSPNLSVQPTRASDARAVG